MDANKNVVVKLLAISIIAAIYFAAGELGLSDTLKNVSASAVWMPTGIAIGSLLIFGNGVWPAVAIGAFLVSWSHSDPALVSLAISVGNTLEAIVAVYLINRFAGGRQVFDQTRNIIRFAIYAAGVSTTISATVGVTALVLSKLVAAADGDTVWLTWWLGDVAGALIVTPVVVLWANVGFRVDRSRLPEQLIVLAILALLFVITSGIFFELEVAHYPVSLLVIPLIAWCAFRLGPRDVATTIVILGAIIVVRMVRGVGMAAIYNPRTELVPILQVFLSSVSLTGLLIAAVVAERRRVTESLRWLATIVEFSNDAIVGMALDGTVRSWNPAAERLYGYRAPEIIGKPVSVLEPPDRFNEMPQLLESIRGGETIERYETKRMRKDRTRIDVSLTMSPIKDERGNIIGAASTSHSIFRWPAREPANNDIETA